MEATRAPEPPSDDERPTGVLRPIGDGRVLDSLAETEGHHRGLARLELMVNTVLDRLTAPEGSVCDEPDAS